MVFYVTIAISAAFVLCGVLFTEPFGAALGALAGRITTGLGRMYMLISAFFLAFAIYLASSRYGKIRLGKPDEQPEFGRFAATPFRVLMIAIAYSLFRALRTDYREERKQMEEIMRRREAGEPVGQFTASRDD